MSDHARPRPRWHPRALNNGLIVGATYRGVSALPPWLSFGIGHAGTWIAYHALRSGTRGVIHNLQGMFPDLGAREVRRLALQTYRNYARDTITFMRSLRMTPEALRASVARVDAAPLEAALAEGRGAIAVSAHFGNWELGGVLLRRLTPHPLAVVVMAEPDADVQALRTSLRRSLDIDTLPVRGSLETGLTVRRYLRENRIVAMLVDRHLGKDRVGVEFFGRQANFLRTPALMAATTGAPLLPTFVYRDAGDRLVVEVGPAIHVAAEGDREGAVQRAMQQVASVMEAQIRRRPACWYQFYDYWATQSGP
jgi:KDO2-lipid IV(A) lauroyltransferase